MEIKFVIYLLCVCCIWETIAASTQLKKGGQNVCSQNITVTSTARVSYTTTETVLRWYCRYRWGYRMYGWCPYRHRRYFWYSVPVTMFRIQHISRIKEVNLCCTGYLPQGDSCPTPHCKGGCLNGKCTSPDKCTCIAGFTGPNCRQDIDECSVNNGGCQQLCLNRNGTFSCGCQNGYKVSALHPERCEDIDECKLSNDLCRCVTVSNSSSCQATCVNQNGTYACNCSDGYATDDNQNCHDHNECDIDNGGCSFLCKNKDGGHECLCPYGYELHSDNKTCLDIDECSKDNGGCQHQCLNTNGSFICQCPKGLQLDFNKKSCSDHDECKGSNHNCEQLCHNFHGSFACGCKNGFKLNADNRTCSDIDECTEVITIINDGVLSRTTQSQCSDMCNNTIGSFHCYCRTGFVLSSDNRTCMDVDECKDGTALCENLCFNMRGGYSCSCNQGYQRGEKFYQCVGKPCVDMPPFDDGSATCLSGVTGDNCSFTCDGGFTLKGSQKRFCQVNAQWDGSTASCQRNRCPILNPPDFAMVVMPCAPFFNSTCEIKCENDYILNGKDNTRTCIVDSGGDMDWNNRNIKCIKTGLCTPNPCNNTGKCEVLNNKTTCNCDGTGYTGNNCNIGVISIEQPTTLNIGDTLSNLTITAKPPKGLNITIVFSDESLEITPVNLTINFPNTTATFNLMAKQSGLFAINVHILGEDASDFQVPPQTLVYVKESEVIATTYNEKDSPITNKGMLKEGCFKSSKFNVVSSKPLNATNLIGIVQKKINGKLLPLSISGEVQGKTNINDLILDKSDIDCFAGSNISEVIDNNAFASTVLNIFNSYLPSSISINVPLTPDKFKTSDYQGRIVSGEEIVKNTCGKDIMVNNSAQYYIYETQQSVKIFTPFGIEVITDGSKKCMMKEIGTKNLYFVVPDLSFPEQFSSIFGYVKSGGSLTAIGTRANNNGTSFITYGRRPIVNSASLIDIRGTLIGKKIWDFSADNVPFTMTDGKITISLIFVPPRLPFVLTFSGSIEKLRWSTLPTESVNPCQNGTRFTATIRPELSSSVTPWIIKYDSQNSLKIEIQYAKEDSRTRSFLDTTSISLPMVNASIGPYSDFFKDLNDTLKEIKDSQNQILTALESDVKLSFIIKIRDNIAKAQKISTILLNKRHPPVKDMDIRKSLSDITNFNLTDKFKKHSNDTITSPEIKLVNIEGQGYLCFSLNYCFRAMNRLFYGDLTDRCISGNFSKNSLVIFSRLTKEERFGGIFKLSKNEEIVATATPYKISSMTQWTFYGELLNQSKLHLTPDQEVVITDVSKQNPLDEGIELTVTTSVKDISKDDVTVFNVEGKILANSTLEKNINDQIKRELNDIKALLQLRDTLSSFSVNKAQQLVENKAKFFSKKKEEFSEINKELTNIQKNLTNLNNLHNQTKSKANNVTLQKKELSKFLNECSLLECEMNQCVPGMVTKVCQKDILIFDNQQECQLVSKQVQVATNQKEITIELVVELVETRECYSICPRWFGFFYGSFWRRQSWQYLRICDTFFDPIQRLVKKTSDVINMINTTVQTSVCEKNIIKPVKIPGGAAQLCTTFSTCATLKKNNNCTAIRKTCSQREKEFATLENNPEYKKILDEITLLSKQILLLNLKERVVSTKLKNAAQLLEAVRTQSIIANSSLVKAFNEKESLINSSRSMRTIVEDVISNKKSLEVMNISFRFDYIYGMKFPRQLVLNLVLDNDISKTTKIISLLDIDNKVDSVKEIVNAIFRIVSSDLEGSKRRKRRSISTKKIDNKDIIRNQLRESCSEIKRAMDFINVFMVNLNKEIIQYTELLENSTVYFKEQNQFIKELTSNNLQDLTEDFNTQMKQSTEMQDWIQIYDTFLINQQHMIRSTNNEKCSILEDCIVYHMSLIKKHLSFSSKISLSEFNDWQQGLLKLAQGNLTLNETEFLNGKVEPLTSLNISQNFCGSSPVIYNNNHQVVIVKDGDLVTFRFNNDKTNGHTDIIWKFNGHIVDGEYEDRYQLKATRQHSGLYTCEITNKFGSTSCGSWQVMVNVRPVILKHPESTTMYVKSGSKKYLLCNATHASEIKWFFQNFHLSDSQAIQIDGQKDVLRLSDEHQSGYYWCNASNKNFETMSEKAIVNILQVSVAVPKMTINMNLTKVNSTRKKRNANMNILVKGQIASQLNISMQSLSNFEYTEQSISFDVYGDDGINAKLNQLKLWDLIVKETMEDRGRLTKLVGNFYELSKTTLTIQMKNDVYKVDTTSLVTQQSLHCPSGKILLRNRFICGSCPAGTKFLSGECVDCDLNTYQPYTGQLECTQCPDNTFTRNKKIVSKFSCISEEEPTVNPTAKCKDGETLSNSKCTLSDPPSRDETGSFFTATTTTIIVLVIVIGILIIIAIVKYYFYNKRKSGMLSVTKNDNNCCENPLYSTTTNESFSHRPSKEENKQENDLYEPPRYVDTKIHTVQRETVSPLYNFGFELADIDEKE